MMDELLETIKKADNGDIQAQYEAAWEIVYGHPDEKLEPDLAEFYRKGLVTEKNVQFADWLEEAADI